MTRRLALRNSRLPAPRMSALVAVALGAVALGAIAVARVAVGRLVVGRARFRSVEIDDLTVRRLHVPDVPPPRRSRAR